MSFKSEWNKISAEGIKILPQNTWSQLKTIDLSNYLIMQVIIKCFYLDSNNIGSKGIMLLVKADLPLL